jgi:hypothetical protein
VKVAEVTPDGTVQVWAAPVSRKIQVTRLPLVVQPAGAALVRSDGPLHPSA